MPHITLYHEIQYQYLLLGGFAVQTRISFFPIILAPQMALGALCLGAL